MASYQIDTTPEQEAALRFEWERLQATYATQLALLQDRVKDRVLNDLAVTRARRLAEAIDRSIATIPADQQPAALNAIADVVTTHGGTVVPVTNDPLVMVPQPPSLPPPPASPLTTRPPDVPMPPGPLPPPPIEVASHGPGRSSQRKEKTRDPHSDV